MKHLCRPGIVDALQRKAGVHDRTPRGARDARHLLLQLVERGAPALRGALDGEQEGLVENLVHLAHGHPGPGPIGLEGDGGVGGEFRRVADRDPAGEHQPLRRRNLEVFALGPEILPLGRAHADGTDPARPEVDLGLGHGVALGAEPPLQVLGAAPRLEHLLARRRKGAGDHQRFGLDAGLDLIHVRAIFVSIAFQLFEIIAQPIEPLLPLGAPGCDPFLRQAERPGFDPAGPDPPDLFRDHQTRAFQHGQMLHHRRQETSSSGRARSLTEAGLRDSRSIIARRVGSASAWKVRSSGDDWLSISFSIMARSDKQAL